MRKAVSFNIEIVLMNRFRKFCDKEGLFMSRRIEHLIVEDLKENDKDTS